MIPTKKTLKSGLPSHLEAIEMPMESESKTIVWFRRDLRIEDNPALSSAAKDGFVLPVFIWCPKEEGQFFPGRASRWWLKQSLNVLDQSLRSLGASLVFIKAETTLSALLQCVEAIGATRLVYNHLYDPVSLVRDHKIKTQLTNLGISVQSYNGDLLYEPWEVYDEIGNAFTTFNAFWEKCLSLPIESTLPLPPWKLVPISGIENAQCCSVDDLGLENEKEEPSDALLSRAWSPGWSSAEKILSKFVDDHLLEYSINRMKVEGATTSFLSPYLHFGEISVRKVYQVVRIKQMHWANEGNAKGEESALLFLRSIGLREYSRYLCFNFPFTHERPLLGNLRHYPWRSDEGQFKFWRQGRTGYPLVDAGMRELWATGWMHNRIRVIVSSFFVKFLLLPWTWGMKYFWDNLLDADLESDILGWQYISGGLPDGHELNRLDNPEVQGCKYDPDGVYVRIWIPELARMPTEWIHHPWDAPKAVLRAAGVELGLNYPRPIIELDAAKERLDDAVAIMWDLDRAARIADLGSDEVVADNSANINNLDIPKVAVKKNISYTTSSFDQKVPSVRVATGSLRQKDPANRNHDPPDRLLADKSEKSYVNMELRSTAESSTARKRSISENDCAVPTPEFSTTECGSLKAHCSESPAKSIRPWKEKDGAEDNEVTETECRSSVARH